MAYSTGNVSRETFLCYIKFDKKPKNKLITIFSYL